VDDSTKLVGIAVVAVGTELLLVESTSGVEVTVDCIVVLDSTILAAWSMLDDIVPVRVLDIVICPSEVK